MKKRVLTGSRTTGSPHLGNYFGAYKPAIELGKKYQLFFFLADFHSLDDLPSKEKLKMDSLDMTATLLSCGLNPNESMLFAQSAVPEVTELCWMLACIAPYGMMLRSVAFKDAQAKGKEVNMGVFNYPILMAADILLYDAELVPVGKDQKQHLEIARDFGQRFNQHYGNTIFTIPEPLISEEIGLIPGCDGEKMSKSKGNVISIFASDKIWKKQIMSIKTSSEGLDEPKEPESCIVFNLYKLVAEQEEVQVMADKYRSGGYGYGHAKLDLLAKIIEIFGPMRDKYDDWMHHPDDLRDIILQGSRSAKEIANKKLNLIHEQVGLIGRPF